MALLDKIRGIMEWFLKLLALFFSKPAQEPAVEEPKVEEKANEIIDLSPVSDRHINQAGIDLLKKFEGCKLEAYRDSVGILTIGYGHTGSDVTEGMSISQDEAEALLKKDLERFERGVEGLVAVPLTDNQFAALVVFSYNVGLGNLGKSTLLKKLNAGDYNTAANEFLKWNKAGGVILLGLQRRRDAEAKLFIS